MDKQIEKDIRFDKLNSKDLDNAFNTFNDVYKQYKIRTIYFYYCTIEFILRFLTNINSIYCINITIQDIEYSIYSYFFPASIYNRSIKLLISNLTIDECDDNILKLVNPEVLNIWCYCGSYIKTFLKETKILKKISITTIKYNDTKLNDIVEGLKYNKSLKEFECCFLGHKEIYNVYSHNHNFKKISVFVGRNNYKKFWTKQLVRLAVEDLYLASISNVSLNHMLPTMNWSLKKLSLEYILNDNIDNLLSLLSNSYIQILKLNYFSRLKENDQKQIIDIIIHRENIIEFQYDHSCDYNSRRCTGYLIGQAYKHRIIPIDIDNKSLYNFLQLRANVFYIGLIPIILHNDGDTSIRRRILKMFDIK